MEVVYSSRGYFTHSGWLQKWVPVSFAGDPIIQIVLPSKFRESVLNLAHDESGHSGVSKTYDRVLRHFIWPRLKRDVSADVKTCHTC